MILLLLRVVTLLGTSLVTPLVISILLYKILGVHFKPLAFLLGCIMLAHASTDHVGRLQGKVVVFRGPLLVHASDGDWYP